MGGRKPGFLGPSCSGGSTGCSGSKGPGGLVGAGVGKGGSEGSRRPGPGLSPRPSPSVSGSQLMRMPWAAACSAAGSGAGPGAGVAVTGRHGTPASCRSIMAVAVAVAASCSERGPWPTMPACKEGHSSRDLLEAFCRQLGRRLWL